MKRLDSRGAAAVAGPQCPVHGIAGPTPQFQKRGPSRLSLENKQK